MSTCGCVLRIIETNNIENMEEFSLDDWECNLDDAEDDSKKKMSVSSVAVAIVATLLLVGLMIFALCPVVSSGRRGQRRPSSAPSLLRREREWQEIGRRESLRLFVESDRRIERRESVIMESEGQNIDGRVSECCREK